MKKYILLTLLALGATSCAGRLAEMKSETTFLQEKCTSGAQEAFSDICTRYNELVHVVKALQILHEKRADGIIDAIHELEAIKLGDRCREKVFIINKLTKRNFSNSFCRWLDD